MSSNCPLLRTLTSAPAASLGTGVRVAVTTTLSAAVARRNLLMGVSSVEERSAVAGAKPGAKTCTRNALDAVSRKIAVPSADVVSTATALGFPALSNCTCAPATAASEGSTTLILISAEAMDVRLTTDRKTNVAKVRKNRIARLLYHAKGLWGRFTPVSWLASKDANLRFSIRMLQPAFPGRCPVTGCDVLAYSCAAARDFHPLPI